MTSAFISEIYTSVQGEGPYAGERQIFVRLAGCPLRCRYCDTPESLTARGHKRWSLDEAVGEIRRLARRDSVRVVSVTGGEPLAQPVFLKALFAMLKKAGFKTYLETAGVHPEALRSLISSVDVVSMDMKLPSATGEDLWKEHRAFLKTGGRKVFVKVVIEKNSKPAEIKQAVGLIASRSVPPLLVLQPATPIPRQVDGPSAKQVADAYRIATARLRRVLVMPQQHKLWGIR